MALRSSLLIGGPILFVTFWLVRQNALNAGLWHAVYHDDLAAVRIWLDRGADINARMNWTGELVLWRRTPLIAACDRKNWEMASLLTARGAAVNAQDRMGMTALMFASFHGNLGTVRELVGRHCDPNLQNGRGATALHLAHRISEDPRPIAKVLLGAGADPDVGASDCTLLASAAQWGASEGYIRLLVQHGADLESRDHAQRTPLIRAVTQKHPETTRELIRLGADPKLTDETGRDALDYAREAARRSGSQRAIQVLQAVEAASALEADCLQR